MYYRGSGPWGAGKGSNLTAAEFDSNTYQVQQQIAAKAAQGVGIAAFNIVGDELYVTLTDHSILGPYPLPVATLSFVGPWAPNTQYYTNQIFTINGATYIVLVNHVSAASFDPGANDGAGHNYYGLLLSDAGSALPVGGAVGMVLEKAGTTDFSVQWAWPTLAGLHDVLPSPAPDAGDLVQWTGGAFSYVDPATLASAPQAFRSLTDVLPTPGPTTGQLVYWNGTKFTYLSQSALTPPPPSPLAFTELTDVLPSPSPNSGDVVYSPDGTHFSYLAPTTAMLQDVGIGWVAPAKHYDLLIWDQTQGLSGKWINRAPIPYVGWTSPSAAITLAQQACLLDTNAGGPGSITIPPNATLAFPASTFFWVRQGSQYRTTIVAGAGVTINKPQGRLAATRAIGSLILVQQTQALDTWEVTGDLAFDPAPITLPSGSLVLDTRAYDTELFPWAPTSNSTISVAAGPPSAAEFGRYFTLIITTSGTTSYTLTFGAGFKSQGTLTTGTVSGKVFVIRFVGDGTNFNEMTRTTAM